MKQSYPTIPKNDLPAELAEQNMLKRKRRFEESIFTLYRAAYRPFPSERL